MFKKLRNQKMYKVIIIALLFTAGNAFSQLKLNSASEKLSWDKPGKLGLTELNSVDNFSQNKIYDLKNRPLILDSNVVSENKTTVRKSKKSPGLAFIYSLIVPGTGQLYAKRFDVGKYFMISEAALWLGFASFTVYGNWLINDAYKYAGTHAGVDNTNKDKQDNFYINIANYDNVEEYNNDMLERGQYDKVYYPGSGFDFHWNSVEERRIYREDKLAADRIHNDRLFIVGAVLVNHLISAISAIVVTNGYNSDISKGSGGVSFGADVIRNFNKVDGIQLKMVKWF